MTAGTAVVALSAQEQALLEGRRLLHGTVTDRFLRLFEAIRSYGPPRVALERAVYFKDFAPSMASQIESSKGFRRRRAIAGSTTRRAPSRPGKLRQQG